MESKEREALFELLCEVTNQRKYRLNSLNPMILPFIEHLPEDIKVKYEKAIHGFADNMSELQELIFNRLSQ